MNLVHTPKPKAIPRGNRWYFEGSSTLGEAKEAYKYWAKQLHPDVLGDEGHGLMQALNAQYEVIVKSGFVVTIDLIVGIAENRVCLTQLWATKDNMVEFSLNEAEMEAFKKRLSRGTIGIGLAEYHYYQNLSNERE